MDGPLLLLIFGSTIRLLLTVNYVSNIALTIRLLLTVNYISNIALTGKYSLTFCTGKIRRAVIAR